MQNRIFRNKLTSTPLATGLFAFIFYCFCLSPTITYGGDSGELIAASWTGGIPHPTGYSLYAILGWAFSHLILVGEVAWRYNLFSAMAAAIAVAFVAASVQRLTQQRLSSIIAALSLAGSYYFASQSVIAEVYVLNAALIALLIYAAIRWKLDRQWKWLAIVAFGIGLIPNVHLSSIYLVPGIVVFLWPHEPKVLFRQHSKTLLGLAFLLLLGFSCTLYLPWRASQFAEPKSGPGDTLIYQPGDWGHPVTARAWWNHVTAKQYHSLLWEDRQVKIGTVQLTIPTFTQPLSKAGEKIIAWVGNITLHYLWLIIFTLIGAINCWKIAPRLGWLLWIPFCFNLFFQSNYNVSGVADIANFLFPCYVVIAIWTGIGYYTVAKVLLRLDTLKQLRAQMLLQALTISAIAIQWWAVYPAINHRNDIRARETALERADAIQKLQSETGKDVHFLTWSDDTLFPFWYAQRVLHKVPSADTPWGPYRHYYWDNGRKMELVKKLHLHNPLVVAEWDSQINEAYPLTPLNPSGTLWLASNRVLPEPAKVLFHLKNEPQKPRLPLPSLLLPSDIKAGELFAGILEINYFPEKDAVAVRHDPRHQSIQSSWIEVAYVASQPADYKAQEGESAIAKKIDASLLSQRIPLVVANDVKHPIRIRMILPLQVPRTFPETMCEIWLRIDTGRWEKMSTVTLVH